LQEEIDAHPRVSPLKIRLRVVRDWYDIYAYNFFDIFFEISEGWENERRYGNQQVLLTYEPECCEFCIFGYPFKMCECRIVGESFHTLVVSFIELERDFLEIYIADK
jgi:hypothetical protein